MKKVKLNKNLIPINEINNLNLNQLDPATEIINKTIINSILNNTFLEIKIKEIYKYETDYIIEKSINMFSSLLSLNLINKTKDKPDIITDNLYINQQPLNKIDNWSFNKIKIKKITDNNNISKYNELSNYNSSINFNNLLINNRKEKPIREKPVRYKEKDDLFKKEDNELITDITLNNSNSSFTKNIATLNLDKSKLTIGTNNYSKNINEKSHIKDNFSTSKLFKLENILNTQRSKQDHFLKTTNNYGKFVNNMIYSKNKKIIDINVKPLPDSDVEEYCERNKANNNENKNINVSNTSKKNNILNNISLKSNNENTDDFKLELKKLRKMFEEKEKDRLEKEKIKKEYESKKQEIDKNKEKLKQDILKKPMYFDFEGNVIKAKNPNNTDIFENTQINETIVQKKIYKTNNLEKNKVIEQIFGPEKYNIPKIHYQLNPINSYNLSDGVELEYYGKIKKGNNYSENIDKIDCHKYNIMKENINKIEKIKLSDKSLLNKITEDINEESNISETNLLKKFSDKSIKEKYDIFKKLFSKLDDFNINKDNIINQLDYVKCNISKRKGNNIKKSNNKINKNNNTIKTLDKNLNDIMDELYKEYTEAIKLKQKTVKEKSKLSENNTDLKKENINTNNYVDNKQSILSINKSNTSNNNLHKNKRYSSKRIIKSTYNTIEGKFLIK